MKRIGLIGGMSWQSTAHYYDLINKYVGEQAGGLTSADLLIHSLNFGPIAQMQREDRWDELSQILIDSAKILERAGADIIAIASNTMHFSEPAISNSVNCDFIHIASPTAGCLIKDEMETVALLGTRFTMEMDFYIKVLEQRGLNVLVPDIGITDLNAIIFDELCLGKTTEPSRQTYIDAISRLAGRGADAVILGCTEIGMLIDDSNSPLPTYDTTDLHAKALVTAALS